MHKIPGTNDNVIPPWLCEAFTFDAEDRELSRFMEIPELIITTRKRSLRRLCFHRCLSVQRRGSLSSQVSVRGLCPGGICPGGSVSRGCLCPGGYLSSGGGSLSRGSLSGGSMSMSMSVMIHHSYWNVFLFRINSLLLPTTVAEGR